MRDFQTTGRSALLATQGAVATSHPLAAKVGVQILEQGGNAMDAAIGTAILLGLCEPQSTGLGGDLFAMISYADQSDLIGLNASGRAPMGLDADALRAAGHASIPLDNINAVTVPGAVDGFCRLHLDHGKLGLDQILAPSIFYAEHGIPVAPRVAFDWDEARNTLRGRAREYYMWQDQPPQIGTHFTAKGQAEVLRRIAREGRAGFYEGEVAEDLVRSLQALGGSHRLEDFANTACDYVTPISTRYRGHDLIELPPNGQGATALLLANILSQFDLAAMDPFGAARAHIEAEATKLAYDARNRYISDPDHLTRLDHMLSDKTARELAALIDPTRPMADPHLTSEAVHKDTVYLSVVDKDRMAVSMIYSIFHSFGSGYASDKFGILFQNRGAGFSLQKGHPNEARGGKRPLHTIIPAFLRYPDQSLMPFGVMGGAYQATGHARLISNIIDYGMDVQSAIDGARCFADQGKLQVERGYADGVIEALRGMGHQVVAPYRAIGGAQAIKIDALSGMLIAGSDPRKDGVALGY
ncbi:gamma-glutamyltransferase family protein [Rhodobacteraceae bacterium XHP0102]|nr:gamma-glutamyltransferase family protein [Rhodobacteraceae bacterium XHP0102]